MRKKCHCGRLATRVTSFMHIRNRKQRKYMDEAVCEMHYRMYHLGIQDMKCSKCGGKFMLSLSILYGDVEVLSCPF